MTRVQRQALVTKARAQERADVLAWIDCIGGALSRRAQQGDEAAALADHRVSALRDGISAGVHVGEAIGG